MHPENMDSTSLEDVTASPRMSAEVRASHPSNMPASDPYAVMRPKNTTWENICPKAVSPFQGARVESTGSKARIVPEMLSVGAITSEVMPVSPLVRKDHRTLVPFQAGVPSSCPTYPVMEAFPNASSSDVAPLTE